MSMEPNAYNAGSARWREARRLLDGAARQRQDADVLAGLEPARRQLADLAGALGAPPPAAAPATDADGEIRRLRNWAARLAVALRRGAPAAVRRANRRRQIIGALGFAMVLLLLINVGELSRWLAPEGLLVTYYRGLDLQQPIWHGVETDLFQTYDQRPLTLWLRSDPVSVRWRGYLEAPRDDDYLFSSQSCDGLRLYLDGQLVIDNWRDQAWGASVKSGGLHLSRGRHRLVVEYYSRVWRRGGLRIKWTGGGLPPNTIIAAPYLYKHP